MKKNKIQPKSNDNVRSTCSENLSDQTNGKSTKKGKKKKQKTTSSREIFHAVLPGIRYCNGQRIRQKPIKVLEVSVMKSAFEELDGIGNERLILWKMSEEETEELKQQVKQEVLHKKRQNIMPLVMQMSKDQIEMAYEGFLKQLNVPDNLPSEECEDENNCDNNASEDENKGEEHLPRNAKVSGLDNHISLANDNSGCDIMPSSDCSEFDAKNCNTGSTTEDICCGGRSQQAEMEFSSDSVHAVVQQLASTEAVGLQPVNCGNSEIDLQSFGKVPETKHIDPSKLPGKDFVASFLIENSLVSKSSKLEDEVSEKCQDSSGEDQLNKGSVSESVSDKCQPDDCNSDSAGNQSMLCSTLSDSIVTNDNSLTNIRTTISPAEILFSTLAASADKTCNPEIPDLKNDLNLCPKLVKRQRSTKAEYSKKIKFYIDDLPCLSLDSLKAEKHSANLTTDYASDKKSTMTPTSTCTLIASTIDQIAQAVAPNKEPSLECTASIKECSTSISMNYSCILKKSCKNQAETQMKALSMDTRRSPNENNDHINLESNIGAQLKPLEVHENVVSFLQPMVGSKLVSNMFKPNSGTEKIKNANDHKSKNGYGKDHKQRDCAHVQNRYQNLANGCHQNLESAQKNHLNSAFDKNKKKEMGKKVSVIASQVKHKANNRELVMLQESKIKAVIPLTSELVQKHSDRLSNQVLKQGKVKPKRDAQKVITANHHEFKAVKGKGKKEMADDLNLFQPQVCEYNNNMSQKPSSCDVNCGIAASSTTTCNLGQTGSHYKKKKTNNENHGTHLHEPVKCTSTDKRKDTTKNTKLHQAEISEICTSRNFPSKNLDLCCAKTNESSDKKLADDSGPSLTEIIESSSETNNIRPLEVVVTGVDSDSRVDTVSNASLTKKSSTVLHTISANSKHEKAYKRRPNKLQYKPSHEDSQSQEKLAERTSFSNQNEIDAKYCGHISVDLNKTELDYRNVSNDLQKNKNDKIPCSETKNDAETYKLDRLTKRSAKLKTSKHESQKDKNCCKAATQVEASVLRYNTSPVTEKPVDHMQVHAAVDLNHDSVKHIVVSVGISSTNEKQMEGDPRVSVYDEHDNEDRFCKPENSFSHPVRELTVPMEVDLESRCTQSMAVDDDIILKNEHLLSQLKDDSSGVKTDSCTSCDVSKNDCVVTRSSSFCLLDYCNSSNNELPDCGHMLSDVVISSSNNTDSNKPISPICSPSRHASRTPSSKKDTRQCVNRRPSRLKKPVAIPLMVKDPKVRSLLEYMCKAEILRLSTDYLNISLS